MTGLVLSLTLFAALPVAPAADVGDTCDQLPASCEAAVVAVDFPSPVPFERAEGYATPAMIDCRAPIVAPLLQALVGECDGTTRDASYRASRDPESERSSGSLRPARRERGAARAAAACAGLPPEDGDATGGVSPSQPMALFALPDPPCFSASRFGGDATLVPPSRQPRPLERPPRA